MTLFVVLHRSDRKNVKFYQYNMAAADILTNEDIATAYLSRSFIDLNEILHRDTLRFSWAFGPWKFFNLNISNIAAADILKVKWRYFINSVDKYLNTSIVK